MDDASVSSHGRVRLDEFGLVRNWSSLAELASEYWRYQRLPRRAKDADDMAACTCVHDLVREPAWDGSLDLIDALLSHTADNGEVALVAAGPLEDLVSPPGQGSVFVAGIEARARGDNKWAAAVAGVWLRRDGDPDVNRRLAVFGARHADGQAPS